MMRVRVILLVGGLAMRNEWKSGNVNAVHWQWGKIIDGVWNIHLAGQTFTYFDEVVVGIYILTIG